MMETTETTIMKTTKTNTITNKSYKVQQSDAIFCGIVLVMKEYQSVLSYAISGDS